MSSKGITTHGFAGARMSAFWYRWAAVTKMGPSGPITSFEPWTGWIPQTSMGFTSVSRTPFLYEWTEYQSAALVQLDTREPLIQPLPVASIFNLVLPVSFVTQGFSQRVWRLSSVPIFEKRRTFAGKGHPVVSPQAFLEFVGDHLPQGDFLDMPILTGEELHDVVMTKNPQLVDWTVGLGMRLALSLSWFVGLSTL